MITECFSSFAGDILYKEAKGTTNRIMPKCIIVKLLKTKTSKLKTAREKWNIIYGAKIILMMWFFTSEVLRTYIFHCWKRRSVTLVSCSFKNGEEITIFKTLVWLTFIFVDTCSGMHVQTKWDYEWVPNALQLKPDMWSWERHIWKSTLLSAGSAGNSC